MSQDPMQNSSPSLDLEELGAYIEGSLDAEGRARVEEILDTDPRAREVLAATLRFRSENATTVHRFPRPRAAFAGFAAAAALLFFVLLPRSADSPSTAELLSFTSAAQSAEQRFGADWQRPVGDVVRDAGGVDDRRLGAWIVVLYAALDGDDRETARLALQRIDRGLDGRFASSVREYRALGEASAEPNESTRNLLAAASDAETRLFAAAQDGRLDAAKLELGRWAEAGRLAALAGEVDAGLFLRTLDAADPAPPELRRDLEDLLRAAERGTPDHDGIAAAFAALLSF